ncbi:MAG: hypothetical protein ACYCYF_11725, partial [Anaerolineae bacterium]
VIGSGATLRVRPAAAQAWVQAFWNHPLNHLSDRIYAWCDELSRSGELFLVLSRNPVDGMSYVREIPALQIDAIETDPEDRERELRYHQLTEEIEGRWWPALGTGPLSTAAGLGTTPALGTGPLSSAAALVTTPALGTGPLSTGRALGTTSPGTATPAATGAHQGPPDGPDQVMLHYAINRPVGAVRGRSDLAQILPWLERYDLWLEDRVRINRYKGAYLWHVRLDNAQSGQLEAKRRQYARVPRSGSIIISDASEHWEAVSPQINADDVAADGKAIRLMIAAGAGVPLHYLAEGDSATRATAREMGTPTLRRFAHRQFLFESILTDLIRTAARRGGVAPGASGEISVYLRFESALSEADREETTTLPERPLPATKGD